MTFPMGRPVAETVDGAVPGIDPTERMVRRLVAVVAAQLDMPSDRVVEALLVAELVARNALRYLTGDPAQVSLARPAAASSCAWARSRRAAPRPPLTTPTCRSSGASSPSCQTSTATEPTNGEERLMVRFS